MIPLDAARFCNDDPAAAVVASFACRWCLRAPVAVVLRRCRGGWIAACHCIICSPATGVWLDGAQGCRVLAEPELQPLLHAACGPMGWPSDT